jgi:septum formation protein
VKPTAPAVEASSLYGLILASTSPRRRELMTLLDIPFSAVSPGGKGHNVDETPLPNESPADLAQRLSRAKAEAVLYHLPAYLSTSEHHKTYVVIGADTVVVVAGKILGKPDTPAEAAQMLALLREQPHFVFSGLTVASLTHPNGRPAFMTRLHHSQVWMRPYTDAEITAYVAGGSPLDKAGAYGIQDQPFAPVERLEGCFAGVMGLPLGELAGMLRQIGLSLPPIDLLCSRYIGARCCQTLAGDST